MSKTVDELIGVYIEASNAVVWEAEKRGLCPMTLDMQRAGIAAVVRAVRDEMTKLGELEFQDSWTVLRKFNEILGYAGDEAAGGSSSNADKATEAGGARCATTSASAPATTHCPVCNGKGWDRFDSPCPPCEAAGRVPATDPAPAVCVWTPRKNMGWFQPSCRKSRMHETSAALKICPSCGLPIKFTEAQR